ncbi:hypothetical protein [Curtobacterium sp. MCSS17_016]|uniref:hypothetical protein n=1 Tax=Curtobacterium sp. MCSS17_016 TaxID=2175644 RepID=UPI000DA9C64E|nr:hypothetical protein [Curtobacterium sp. MCSS17_016]WIE81423.1 hypothetical protein DEJ19_019500 [Curtobacterium sp. MCSS17_016]
MRRLTITIAAALTVAATLTGCTANDDPTASPTPTSKPTATAAATTPTPTATATAVADPKAVQPTAAPTVAPAPEPPAAAPTSPAAAPAVSALAQHIYDECNKGAADAGVTLQLTANPYGFDSNGRYQLLYPFTFNDGHDDPYAIYSCVLTDNTADSTFIGGGMTDSH